MPISDAAYVPPTSRLRTVMTSIGDALSPKAEAIRYFLRQPEEEEKDKAYYIEPGVADLVNESLDGSQRSYIPFRVAIHGYIAEKDTRTGADFIDETIATLMTSANRETFRTAFGSGLGFSIEGFENVTPGFGENFFQFSMVANCLFHQD